MKREFKCPECGAVISPGSMMGSIMTPVKLKAIKKNLNRNGRPKGAKDLKKRKRRTICKPVQPAEKKSESTI